MESTITYNSTTKLITFTNTTDLSAYYEVDNAQLYLKVYQETIPGAGYSVISVSDPINDFSTPSSITFVVSGDGIYRLKMGYVITQEVYDEQDVLLEIVDLIEESDAEGYYHFEKSTAVSKVLAAFMKFLIEKDNVAEKLRAYRYLHKLLHEADIAYTIHNYIEADKNIKLIK